MITLKYVRDNPQIVKADLKKRGDDEKYAWIDEILESDAKWRSLLLDSEKLRKDRNELNAQVSKLKKEGKDASSVIEQVKEIPKKIADIEETQNKIKADIDYKLLRLPNILHESVKTGRGEEDNTTVKIVGDATKPKIKLKSHVDIISEQDLCDTERAGKVSGSRFYFLKNDLVRMDLALQQYALDILQKSGYTIVLPPFMIRKKYYEGATDLSDFENVMYRIESRDEESAKEEDTLYLIATSEHAIAAMHSGEIFEEKQLPLKYAGVSPCFRREAGSHGKDTKGIFRVHQFNKVEQFIFSRHEDSWNLFEELQKNAEKIVSGLGIPYRVVSMCTAEMGTVAAKKHDIEVWMPAQGQYRELISCSNCTEYQATRLGIRYRTSEGNKFVHTLNSTAVATTRAIVAIIENFQEVDGSIVIPKALRPYMGGQEKITAKKN